MLSFRRIGYFVAILSLVFLIFPFDKHGLTDFLIIGLQFPLFIFLFFRRYFRFGEAIFLLFLIFTAIVSMVAGNYFSGFPHVLGLVLLYQYSIGRFRKLKYSRTMAILYISFVLFLCFLSLNFFEYRESGSFSIFTNDPNITVVILSTPVFAVLSAGAGLLPTIGFAVFLILLIPLTQCRMLTLAALVFILFKFLSWAKYRKVLRAFVFISFLLSIFAQPLVGLMYFGYSPQWLLDTLPSSDRTRVGAFLTAMTIAVGNELFVYSGLEHMDVYLKKYNLKNLPHNWFMMMWIRNGLIMTILYAVIFLIAISRINYRLLPAIEISVIFATILGFAAFSTPLNSAVLSFIVLLRPNREIN